MMVRLLFHKFFKLIGTSFCYSTDKGVKVLNSPHDLYYDKLFLNIVNLSPDELLLGYDGLNDDCTLLGTPIRKSPHFELVRLISEDLSIDNSDYILRIKSGQLDGRPPIKYNKNSSTNYKKKFDWTFRELNTSSYRKPIVYEIDSKYFIYDGKHRIATACLIGLKAIDCILIRHEDILCDSYTYMVFKKMLKKPSKYSKNIDFLSPIFAMSYPKCLVVNRCQTDNLGDQAISSSIRKIIEICGFKTDITEFSNTKSRTYIDIEKKNDTINNKTSGRIVSIIKKNVLINDIKWRFINSNLCRKLKYHGYEYVFIGGGELLQSNGQFPLALYKWCSSINNNKKKTRIILFGIGVTRFFSNHDKKLIAKALKHVDCIFVRDDQSKFNLLSNFGINSIVIPDVVYINDFTSLINDSVKDVILYGITDHKRVLKYGIIGKSKEEYYEYCLKDIENILKLHKCEIQLFFTTTSDYRACLDFIHFSNIKYNKNFKICQTNTLQSLIQAYSHAHVVYSPRMHGCILGEIIGVKSIPILISEKMKSYLKIQKHNRVEKRTILISEMMNIFNKF